MKEPEISRQTWLRQLRRACDWCWYHEDNTIIPQSMADFFRESHTMTAGEFHDKHHEACGWKPLHPKAKGIE